jgi:hypothetical protein
MFAAYCARSNTCRAGAQRAIPLWLIPLVGACLLLVEGLYAPAAYAGDHCVDPSNPGACFGTIQAAVNAAASGDTITVAAGTYVEHVNTGSKLLHITGAGPGSTVVDGSNSGRVFRADADLTLAEITVQRGKAGANQYGGGIYAANALTLTNVHVLSSTAGLDGGGAAVSEATTILGGVFFANRCTDADCAGGGLYSGELLMLSGAQFLTNTAQAGGGGAFAGSAVLNDGLFLGNRCTGDNCVGGGLAADGALVLTGTHFLTNTAFLGGGASATGAATLNGGVFQGNLARAEECIEELCGVGGGLYALGSLTLTDTQFLGNRAESSGGGAVAGGPAVLNGGIFQNNACYSEPCLGGGFSGLSTLALTGTQFLTNTATAGGGAAAIKKTVLHGGLFLGNTGLGECAEVDDDQEVLCGGGGLYAGSLEMTATQFLGNRTAQAGGGVAVAGWATLDGGLFFNNASDGEGGGIWSVGRLIITSTQFTSNKAVGSGGAAFAQATAVVQSALFEANTCTLSECGGGGLYADGGVTLIDTQFFSNTAKGGGGGAATAEQATVTRGMFQSNACTDANLCVGGGLYAASGATLIDTQFLSNTARLSGGGADVGGLGSSGPAILNGGMFQGNSGGMQGGGLAVDGSFTMTGTQFLRNTATMVGGGAGVSGPAILNGGLFQGNSGGMQGGGLAVDGSFAMTGTQFLSNTATMVGGGVGVNGPATLNGGVFQGNSSANMGGGLYVDDTTGISNSTFAANSATTGGGLYNSGALTLTNSTFAANSATMGGGLHNKAGGRLWLRNTLIAGNSGGDCAGAGAIVQNANNLVQDGSCAAALHGDPVLAPHGDYGGGTQTLALLPGSPAIDAGDGALCPAADQRGAARVAGACDIGAFESRGFQIAVTGGSPQATAVNSPFAAPLQALVSSAHGEPAGPGGRITFTPPPAGAGINLVTPITVATDVSGSAALAVSANIKAGSYGINASASGVVAPATFALTNLPLQLVADKVGDGRGRVTSVPPVLDCGLTCTANLDYGAQVTLAATAEAGSTFTGWTGGCTGSSECRLTMTANQVVTAFFLATPAPLAINDTGSALDTQPATVAVTANDRDYAGGGLIVTSAGAPSCGAATVGPDGQTVVYTAAAGYAGVDSFTCTVVDINGRSSSAIVAMVVANSAAGQDKPQVQPVFPDADAAAIFTATQASMDVQLPGGSLRDTAGRDGYLLPGLYAGAHAD